MVIEMNEIISEKDRSLELTMYGLLYLSEQKEDLLSLYNGMRERREDSTFPMLDKGGYFSDFFIIAKQCLDNALNSKKAS